MKTTQNNARFDATGIKLIIEKLVISQPDVMNEARHWVAGERGQRCDDTTQLAEADLTEFATEALVLGARALSLTAQTTETRALERMLKDVGEATRQAGDATALAAKSATETVTKAADDAKKAIIDADELTRKQLAGAVKSTRQELLSETRRLFGGDNPELLERLQPVLEKFGSTLEKQVQAGANELLVKAAKQLDPSDPTSPLAKHTAGLTKQQAEFAQQIEKGQVELGKKVEQLSTALKLRDAKSSVAKVTPIKGASFEEQLHGLMTEIAAGLGDEYENTTAATGLIQRCKKGDGVLSVSGQAARVVIEMTDSTRGAWGEYLAEAERNRGAVASLGIVRAPEQNGGHSVRVLGQRRVIIAFDPGDDDPELLRTSLLLVRAVAITAASRTGDAEIDTAEEKIVEAVDHLEKIDAIKKAAGAIQKSAGSIENQCSKITTDIRRLLDQALASLSRTGEKTHEMVQVSRIA